MQSVPWIRDEVGQMVEAWRKRVGDCYVCGWPAYRWAEVEVDGEVRRVPICTRENARDYRNRMNRTQGLHHKRRAMRDVDVKTGLSLVKRMLDASGAINCAEVHRAVNRRRERDGLEPVQYEVVRRRICSVTGYEQGE